MRAIRWFGAAEAVRASTGAPWRPGHQGAYARQLAAARAAVDEATFASAWAEGQALAPDEAIVEALAAQESTAGAAPGSAEDPPGRPAGPLTPREREVAVLIARGLTDRQIGDELVIARGTAGVHVKHILDKLGFGSRAQVAAWAAEQGLLAPRTR